jgi:hypothetical protein
LNRGSPLRTLLHAKNHSYSEKDKAHVLDIVAKCGDNISQAVHQIQAVQGWESVDRKAVWRFMHPKQCKKKRGPKVDIEFEKAIRNELIFSCFGADEITGEEVERKINAMYNSSSRKQQER